MIGLSKQFTNEALVHNQLTAKRSHESKGATETRKLNNIHRIKATIYVTGDKNQDFKNKSSDNACVATKGDKKSGTVQIST